MNTAKSEATADADNLAGIVSAAQQGDSDAFEQLVTRFQVMATAIGCAMLGDLALAQDAAQEAFIEAYLCLSALQTPAAFPGWFRRIVVKQCDRIYRRPHSVLSLDDAPITDYSSDPASIFDAQTRRREVRRAVDALPPAQKLVAGLFYLVGFSQREIMACLALPAGTVKKRLFEARKTLRSQMKTYDGVKEVKVDKDKLSSEAAKNRVMFFVALHKHDLGGMKRLLDLSPELATTPFEWDTGPYGYYWPLGYTAMHWAAATDDAAMVDALLARRVAVDIPSSHERRTALHVAALMGRSHIVARLLDAGANGNTQDNYGHTPLHLAAWANQPVCAAELLHHAAAPGVKDSGNRTPADWAAIRSSQALVDLLTLTAPRIKPLIRPDRTTSALETGLKIVDLCAPLVRGGINALFSPRSGVGKMVTANALIYVMATYYGGHTIWLGLEHGLFVREGLELDIRNAGLAHAVDVVTARQDEPLSFLRATDDAVAAARDLSARGQPVLLLAASPVALSDGVIDRLRTAACDTPTGEITVVVYGSETAGAEPDAFGDLDAVLSFDLWRAQHRLHPSIDILNSRSKLLERGEIDKRHVRLARQTRRLLRRHQDLTAIPTGDLRGLDGLPVNDDTVLLKRAHLMHEYLTQPMPDVELFFQRPALYVSMEQTLADCEAILAGHLDHVGEGVLSYGGAIDHSLIRDARGAIA